jgi:hypothetical protein
MKKYILATLTSVILAQTAFAIAPPPAPAFCPGETAIKNYGVSRNTMEFDGAWIAARRSFAYNTNVLWSFVIGNIPATDTNDAYLKATAALQSIFLEMGPFYDVSSNSWVCLYGTGPGYPAVTVHPPLVVPFNTIASTYLKM